ncbi:MAG: succinylglutamate desuccinylase/aspartoacylase family protein [Sandarakinorhabdus sp.]|nr:succinylglutamate desuccinylase/aspartoacylase family protein [Sandarakinorhabdus sp.]
MKHFFALLLLAAIPANAAAAAPAGAPTAAPAGAHTQRVGSLDGTAIIDRLDVSDIKAGTTERLWFRAGTSALAQPWLVPVIVIKGARPGPKLLVTAGIHGDELNGIDVIHRLASIDPATMAGTLVMVPGLNTPGLLQSTREWTPDDSRSAANLNREMPGTDGGRGVADYAGRLWTRLMRPNADQAVDLHTQSRGTAYPMYAFASTPRTLVMAELMAPDIIKLDQGEKGTVENEMVRAGVPAITLELGRPEVFDREMVGRAVGGIVNLMREMAMLAGPFIARSPITFTGNTLDVVRSPRAGFAVLVAPLGSAVVKGQDIAIISDAFGRVTDTVTAPASGRISTIFTDPRRGRGDMIARIISKSDDPKCAMGC